MALISSSFHSFTFLSSSTSAFFRISWARLLPIPKIYVNAITPLLCFGISTPAILAITYPCLCLNFGFFLLITYNLPFLRTILQSALLFFTDALTFISLIFNCQKKGLEIRFYSLLFFVNEPQGPLY